MQTIPILQNVYMAYKRIIDINIQLTKRWRHSLGISTENSILACIEQLIMAKNAPKALKITYLIKADSHLEITRMKLRLMLELKLANETKIFQTQKILLETGRMLGGCFGSRFKNRQYAPNHPPTSHRKYIVKMGHTQYMVLAK